MKIFALDPATTSGWARGSAGSRPIFGSKRFGPPNASTGEVVSLYRVWLTTMLELYMPDWVVREAVYIPRWKPKGVPVNMYVIERLISLAGVTDMLCWERCIPVRRIETQKATLALTGSGSHGGRDKKKAATVAAVRALGHDVENDNQADAISIWYYSEAILAPKIFNQRPAGPLFSTG